jgi:hypothetical protein
MLISGCNCWGPTELLLLLLQPEGPEQGDDTTKCSVQACVLLLSLSPAGAPAAAYAKPAAANVATGLAMMRAVSFTFCQRCIFSASVRSCKRMLYAAVNKLRRL